MFIEHDDPIKEQPFYFPLYRSWKRFRRGGFLAAEFDDFHAFYDWAIENGYEYGDIIYRPCGGHKIGPRNGMISKAKANADAGREISNIKAGSKNSPCIGCACNKDGSCSSFSSCVRYATWLNKCWEDFRKAAGIKEET